MTASMWPDVAAAIRTVFAASTLADVYDGTPVNYEALERAVIVGADAASDEGISGTITQDWRDAGPAPAAHREEWGEVVCTVWAQSGDDDLGAVRDAAFAILDECLNAVHNIVSLGIPEVTNLIGLRSGTPIQRRTKNGVICEIAFRVRYQAIFS